MKNNLLAIVFLLSLKIVNAQNFGGNKAKLEWQQINTPTTQIIFPKGYDSIAMRVANVSNTLNYNKLNKLGDTLKKWKVVLQTQTTIPNAYVRMAPIMSELYMTPSQDNFSQGSLRWDDNLIIHENRHIQQFSNFNKGFTKLFTFLLGQEGQLFANGITVPDYFFEGDAVWQETFMSKQGRGRMPFFFNSFKSLWNSNKNYSWMKLRSGSYKDLIPDHYELGYQIVAYGYEKYGNDFWQKVTSDAVEFKGLFWAFNNAIKRYSGVSYKQFRENAMQYFKEKTNSNAKINTTAEVEENFITSIRKNNIIDYTFPNYMDDETIIAVKKSSKQIPGFYKIQNGKEELIRVKDVSLDDYYSYKNGKIVYCSYQTNARYINTNYSVIQLLNVNTKTQVQLTTKSYYFSPDLNDDGTEILAVSVLNSVTANLVKLNCGTGKLLATIPNKNNYFFTQTKFLNDREAVSAVRDLEGKMALVKINLTTGESETLTPFTYNVIGYPVIKNQIIYYNAMDNSSDKIFAFDFKSKANIPVTFNANGVYYPAINAKNELLYSAFTLNGYRLAKKQINPDFTAIQ